MRSPDGRSKVNSKQITKTCRKCHKQLPTACKMCSCGFHFRKSSPPTTLEDEQSAVKEDAVPLRSRRTRNKRPQFFDSMEYGSSCLGKKSRLSGVAGKVTKKSDRAENTNKKSTKDAMELLSVSSISALSHSSESLSSTTPASSSSSSSSAAAATVAPDNRSRTTSNLNCPTLRGYGGADRPLLLSIILAEINRKYMSVSFRPA